MTTPYGPGGPPPGFEGRPQQGPPQQGPPQQGPPQQDTPTQHIPLRGQPPRQPSGFPPDQRERPQQNPQGPSPQRFLGVPQNVPGPPQNFQTPPQNPDAQGARPGYGAPPHAQAEHERRQHEQQQKQPRDKAVTAIWALGLVSLAAVVLGLSLSEDGHNAWHTVHAWGALAILGAILTLAPAAAGGLNLSAQRAWQAAACGTGALLLFWVLFVLPSAGSNTSLAITVGVAAGIIAVWLAPGRETDNKSGGSSAQSREHSW